MDSSSLLRAALKLSKAERILLVESIWDSIAESDDGLELTEAQKSELDRRLARLARTGSQGSSWEDVKKRLLTKRKGA